jgi:phage-related protein
VPHELYRREGIACADPNCQKRSCPSRQLSIPLRVNKRRELCFYRTYFDDFYSKQTVKVQKRILWTLRVIEDLARIPEIYFKHLEGTDGICEIRVQAGSDIFRIFCFFDDNKIVVVGNGFQKKTQRTPDREIERAKKIKREYHEEKKLNKSQ